MYTCQFCNEEIEKRQSFNAHKAWCEKSPKGIERRISGKNNFSEFNESRTRSNVTKNCVGCYNVFETKSPVRKYCTAACRSAQVKLNIFREIESGKNDLPNKQYRTYLIEKYGASCMDCGWNKKNPVTNKCPIELEHIDGNSENNLLSNLKLMCPNCHSLTPTYKALNKGNGRASRMQRYRQGKSY